jgi:hypothetical protein
MKSIGLFLVGVSSTTAIAQPPTMHEVAKRAVRPDGAPQYADVCLRYGWIRKKDFPTVEDAKDAIRHFHATRVDWFYPGTHTAQDGVRHVTPESKAFIDWCHANGMKIGGAINNNTKKTEWKYKKHHLDRYVGEPSNADFIASILAWGKAQIDAGVDTMVCDDIFKYDKARQDLWNEKVLAELKAYKPGFTMAGNSGHSITTEYVKRFAVDFHYSDNNFILSPGGWWKASQDHRSQKSAFLLQPNRPRTKEQLRAMIALGYAAGAHLIAPWDAYIHGGKRLFSDPADYADLYGFARALGQAGYLNEYEDAAVGGYDLKENRYGEATPIAITGGSEKLSVYARAQPGKANAPLVVHLVESGKPTAAKLHLDKASAAQLGAKGLKCQLLTPPAYTKADHDRAQSSKDYAALSHSVSITPHDEGDTLVFDILPFKPWTVLIISAKLQEAGK